ncbi:MAG TPA: tRNA lysidine(34) synthetase TilS [Planctomycetota bacterium]|nr:tRNA lysidine(34) synthetase TilS [Planctomycetota bacterium]
MAVPRGLAEHVEETIPAAWAGRWSRLALAAGLAPSEPVVLALSGGADSVLLLHLLASAREAPSVLAVHVDHGLRGAESRGDARFCARLCRQLGVRFALRRLELEAGGPSLEARAREQRYAALAAEARRARVRTILTGHHADDSLETLLMRWIRGTGLGGLAALRRRLELGDGIAAVRPLAGMRRAEVRALLAGAGLRWREDSSNLSPRFTRNRVRNVLLPALGERSPRRSVENLRAFGRAVEELERHLASATAHLAWQPPPGASASRSRADAHLGGTLPRERLTALPRALRRRALWRLVLEGTGRAPGRALLELVLDDLERGRRTRRALPLGWSLLLRSEELVLEPPARVFQSEGIGCEGAQRRAGRVVQLELPFAPPTDGMAALEAPPGPPGPPGAPPDWTLLVPGAVELPDGRRIRAELVRVSPGAPVPRSHTEVELSAERLPQAFPRALTVRFARAGDRFRPLGGPGSRPLRRFLADCGIPREERGRVPLVIAADEILWVAGVRPSESARVAPDTRVRLRLALEGTGAEEAPPRSSSAEPAAAPSRAPGLFGDGVQAG